MIGARIRPPGPLLCVWFRFHKPRRLSPACCLLGLHRLMLAKTPVRVADYRAGVFLFPEKKSWPNRPATGAGNATQSKGSTRQSQRPEGRKHKPQRAQTPGQPAHGHGHGQRTKRSRGAQKSRQRQKKPRELEPQTQTGHGQTEKQKNRKQGHRHHPEGRTRKQRPGHPRARAPGQTEKQRHARQQQTEPQKHPQGTTGEKRAGNRHRPGHPPRFAPLAGAPAGKAPACGRHLPPCAGLALALPAGATAGIPARRRRSPRPAARECARKAALAPPVRAAFSNAAPRRGKGCSSSPQPVPRLGWGAAPPARGTGPLRRAASAEAEPRGLACAAGVARLARLAEAPPTGPEARTAPQPPQSGGRAAPEHLRRNRRGAGGGQGPRSGPAGAWPCGPTGWPRATAGGQLDRAGLARPWPPHFPDRPAGAGRAGGGTAAAQGGQGERPAGRRGGWDAARPQAGHGREPLSPCRQTVRENKRGSAHRALPLGFAD